MRKCFLVILSASLFHTLLNAQIKQDDLGIYLFSKLVAFGEFGSSEMSSGPANVFQHVIYADSTGNQIVKFGKKATHFGSYFCYILNSDTTVIKVSNTTGNLTSLAFFINGSRILNERSKISLVNKIIHEVDYEIKRNQSAGKFPDDIKLD